MKSVAKHRRPAETGYARGEETRARIVSTALRLFGEKGFEGASTRDIATAAGVNAPALQYYFDSKEGLYLACIDHIAARIWEHMDVVVKQAETALAANAADEDLIEAFCAIQSRLAQFMFTLPEAQEWRLFMMRLHSGSSPAAGVQAMFQRVNKRMRSVTAGIVGHLLGLAPTDDETQVRAIALIGQLTVFQVKSKTALAALNWDKVDGPRLELLQKIILEHTTTLLRSMQAQRDKRADGREGKVRAIARARRG